MFLNHLSYRGSPAASEIASGAWKSQSTYFGVRFPGIRKHHGRTGLSVKSAPPSLGGQQITHQIRRHMQRKEKEPMEWIDDMRLERSDEQRCVAGQKIFL